MIKRQHKALRSAFVLLVLGLALLTLRANKIEKTSMIQTVPSQARLHNVKTLQRESLSSQQASKSLEQFHQQVSEALQSMKGEGVKVTANKKPPTKRSITTESGIELIEMTYENGGKTYLPKNEDY